MDIRVEKTRQSIINAFIELRSHRELERITIKELCERARINKSTFYSHYQDIYHLSDTLETEVVVSIMENLSHPEKVLEDTADFSRELFMGFLAKDALGVSPSVLLMMLLMLPFFLLAMFERHGQPLEVLIRHFIQARFVRPRIRVWQNDNFYQTIERSIRNQQEVQKILRGKQRKNQADKG